MFRYSINGKMNELKRPLVIALTDYTDIAEYIASHAAEALDPDGTRGLEVSIVDRPEASCFIHPTKPKAAQTEGANADS